MGNLKKHMPITSACFGLGTLALIAAPGFAGFFSKESILLAAWEKNPLFFWVAALIAGMTAFYMLRVCFIALLGKERSENAEHAHEVGLSMRIPLILLAIMAVVSGYGFVANALVPFNGFEAESFHFNVPFFVGTAAMLAGVALAYYVYGRCAQKDPLAANAFSRALRARFYIDCFYDKILIGGVQYVAVQIIDFIDGCIINGLIVRGYADLMGRFGRLLTWLRGNDLRASNYMTILGILVLLCIILFY